MTVIKFDASTGNYSASIGGKTVRSYSKSYVEKRLAAVASAAIEVVSGEETKPEFDINTRFKFVEQLVTMVAKGVQPSAIITGEGGLGKSYTVVKTLEANGYKTTSNLEEFAEGDAITGKRYTTIKGFSTAKGLYMSLYENNGRVIVFDDCDSILKDPVALNLLKGALDSYDKRIISWNADTRESEVPRRFEFTGRIIFISNMSPERIDQAVRSRSMSIDLTMSTDQKIDRMEHIAMSDEFMPEYGFDVKSDALKLIREVKATARELSLRTLISVAKVRATTKDWEQMAKYLLTA